MTPLQRAFYNFLKPRGRRILKKLIVTLCAGDAEVLKRVRVHHVALRAEKYVSELPFFYFLSFKVALYVFNFAIPPLSWKFKAFTRMSLENRLRYFDEWQSSNFYIKRTLFKMLQVVCVPHIYAERKLLVSIGYERSMQHRMKGPNA